VTEREPERAEVVDLFEALQASLEGARRGGRSSGSRAPQAGLVRQRRLAQN